MEKYSDFGNAERIFPSEAARIMGVSTKTLATMADKGEIHCQKLPSGHRRYYREEVEEKAKPQSDEGAALAAEKRQAVAS